MNNQILKRIIVCLGLCVVLAVVIGSAEAKKTEDTITVDGYTVRVSNSIISNGITAAAETTYGGTGGYCTVSATMYAIDRNTDVEYTISDSAGHSYSAVVGHGVANTTSDVFYKIESSHNLTKGLGYHTWNNIVTLYP